MMSPAELKPFFKLWEIVKDLIDQCIDYAESTPK